MEILQNEYNTDGVISRTHRVILIVIKYINYVLMSHPFDFRNKASASYPINLILIILN